MCVCVCVYFPMCVYLLVSKLRLFFLHASLFLIAFLCSFRSFPRLRHDMVPSLSVAVPCSLFSLQRARRLQPLSREGSHPLRTASLRFVSLINGPRISLVFAARAGSLPPTQMACFMLMIFTCVMAFDQMEHRGSGGASRARFPFQARARPYLLRSAR